MLMQNRIQLTSPLNKITHKFDLKGSFIGRKSLDEKNVDNSKLLKICSLTILKDQDLKYLLSKRSPNLINIPWENKKEIRHVINADARFLSSQNLIDYSFLLAVEKKRNLFQEDDLLMDHETHFIESLSGQVGLSLNRQKTISSREKA